MSLSLSPSLFLLLVDVYMSSEFKDIDVMAQAMTFFVDGFETSSVAMSFTLFELAKHADIQDKLRKEVDSVLTKHGGEVTYEAIQEMHYLDMVISGNNKIN